MVAIVETWLLDGVYDSEVTDSRYDVIVKEPLVVMRSEEVQ